MVSSALADRMAAFEKGGAIKKAPGVAGRAAAFETGKASNAQKNYKSNRDLTGIEDKANKSWQNRNQAKKVDVTGSVTTTGSVANSKSIGAKPSVTIKEEKGESKSKEFNTGNDGSRVHGSVKHFWSEKKSSRAPTEDKSSSSKDRKKGRPGLGNSNTAFDNISQRRMELEKNAKPPTPKKRKIQIAKCVAISILIVACIVVATITIVTGWGDGSIETEFDKQAVVFGKLVSLSQDGFLAVVQDDFGSNQIYRFAPSQNPRWQPEGMQFRSQGRVQIRGDGRKIAYVDPRTKRLVFEEYDEVLRDWVDTEDAPFLGGDDISLSGDFTLLTVGTYGQGSITLVNSKVGEGIITTYKYEGESWVPHGDPLIKIFGLDWFGMSPDGTGLLVVAKNDGNTTLNGYNSVDLGNSVYEWLKGDRTTNIASTEVDFSVSNGGYAVSTRESAQAYLYSGRKLGQEILANGSNNITSVALSTDGRTIAVGSVSPGLTGLVDWYRFPSGTDDNWATLGEALQDNAAYFGSALLINQGSSQLAVESGAEGDENVHFYGITYKSHRRIG